MPADVGAALHDMRLEVLVAEDNRDNQAVIQALLGRAGLHVDIASDGVQVVAAADAKSYDIILMGIICDSSQITLDRRRHIQFNDA